MEKASYILFLVVCFIFGVEFFVLNASKIFSIAALTRIFKQLERLSSFCLIVLIHLHSPDYTSNLKIFSLLFSLVLPQFMYFTILFEFDVFGA